MKIIYDRGLRNECESNEHYLFNKQYKIYLGVIFTTA